MCVFRRVFLLEQNLKIVAYASVGRIMTHKGGRCVFWVILGNFDFHIIGRHEFSLAPIWQNPDFYYGKVWALQSSFLFTCGSEDCKSVFLTLLRRTERVKVWQNESLFWWKQAQQLAFLSRRVKKFLRTWLQRGRKKSVFCSCVGKKSCQTPRFASFVNPPP